MSDIRTLVLDMLARHGHDGGLGDDDPIFTSGLLDSLAATELMMALETEYGIDLADADFDISRLDTLRDLQGLVAQAA